MANGGRRDETATSVLVMHVPGLPELDGRRVQAEKLHLEVVNAIPRDNPGLPAPQSEALVRRADPCHIR